MRRNERKFVKNDHEKDDHAIVKRTDTKRIRNEKLERKRGNEKFTHEVIVKTISSLNFNIESLPILAKLLSNPNIDMYFGPSNVYPEYKGPYIFPNSKPFEWLISLMDIPAHREDVLMCFLGVSAYEASSDWIQRLIPIIPRFLNCIKTHPKQVLWILSNMCIDNINTRDLILNQNVCDLVCSIFNMEDWHIISCSAHFLRSLFIHQENLPNAEKVSKLWNIMTNRVLIEHFPVPIMVMEPVAEDILRTIDILIKYSDPYKMLLIQNNPLFERILKYSLKSDKLVQFLSAQILSTITEFKSTHQFMVSCIPTFVEFLNFPSADLRKEGSSGLANLAETPEILPVLCTDLVFNAIQMQFEYTDVSSVLREMYLLIDSIVITAYQANLENVVFPMVMNRFMYRICQSLFLEMQFNLVTRSIQSLKCFAKWNLNQTRELMESYDAISRLESLTLHMNIEIQIVAEELVNILDNNVEVDEDNC